MRTWWPRRSCTLTTTGRWISSSRAGVTLRALEGAIRHPAPGLAPGQYRATNMHRFLFDLLGSRSTHYVNWQAASARFKSYQSHSQEPLSAATLSRTRRCSATPTTCPGERQPEGSHQLWHLTGLPPSDRLAGGSSSSGRPSLRSCRQGGGKRVARPRARPAPIPVAWTVTGASPPATGSDGASCPPRCARRPQRTRGALRGHVRRPLEAMHGLLAGRDGCHGQTSYSPVRSVVVSH